MDPTHQATWKNISPLLINGKHFPTPMERKQSSCMKQKVRSQKNLSYSKGCIACISQISLQNVNHFYDANLPFKWVPKSRFILTRSFTQQVFINHVCFLLNLQSYMTDLISPSRSDRHWIHMEYCQQETINQVSYRKTPSRLSTHEKKVCLSECPYQSLQGGSSYLFELNDNQV